MNQTAQKGFSHAADVYEQARPSYPTEVVDFIKSFLNETPDIVVDLGAGTGKLTRLLEPLNARELIAIEPVAEMREKLKNIPIVTKILDATAEQLPLDDHTVDMIICAQSFHWFATHSALAEFHRVLKPNGRLVLIWNSDDQTDKQWRIEIETYIQSFKPPGTNRYKAMEWKTVFDDQKYFSSLEVKQFKNFQKITRDLGIKRVLSTSFIGALPPEEQAKVIEHIRQILDNAEEIRGINEFDIEHITNIYWCSALP